MDQEFVDKLNSVSVWTTQDDKSEQSTYSISFDAKEDGLVHISATNGEIVHRLKLLRELYAPGKTGVISIKWDDPHYLHLLHTIEGAIKRVYLADSELTDSAVILALDTLSVKPEVTSTDAVITRINQELRLVLSMSDFSRDDVKAAVRKILASVKRHKAAAGIRGYLNFIMEYVP